MKNKLLLVFVLGGFMAAGARAQGKFSGYMFGDYFYNVGRDSIFNRTNLPNSALTGAKDMQAFQLRRIYFAYDNDISEKFTARFRLEADQVSNTVDGKFGVAVKDAFLRWKNIFSGSDLYFGLQPTTAFDISEGAWGFRSLEKTIMDLRGIIPSRDLGIALRGKFDDDGVFNYWAMIANGTGQKPATSKYKRYSLTFHVKPTKEWQFTLTGDYRAQADIIDPNSTTVPKGAVGNGVSTGALFIGYAEPGKYSFGAEGFIQSTANGFNDGATTPHTTKGKSALGVSLWGNVYVQDDLSIVARYDIFDPNTDSDSKGDARNYIIGGLNWKVDKNVSIMPNVQIETYQDVPLPNGATYTFKSSVTARVTFYYVFL